MIPLKCKTKAKTTTSTKKTKIINNNSRILRINLLKMIYNYIIKGHAKPKNKSYKK